jgi:hypothetical protein
MDINKFLNLEDNIYPKIEQYEPKQEEDEYI